MSVINSSAVLEQCCFDKKTAAYVPRINAGGNFCGHDPLSPRFELVKQAKKGKGGLPRVLTLCMERITCYFHRPRKVLPSLDLANGSDRQQRSERREACVILLVVLLKRTDLVSLRVGIPTCDGFMSYTVDYIARETGMSLKRVERALADLRAAGIITISQPRQLLPDGSWKGLASVKAISKHLFSAFGLGSMLQKERDKASKRLKKKQRQWEQGFAPEREQSTRTGKARFSLFMGGVTPQPNNKPKQMPTSGESLDDFEYRKQQMIRAGELKQANPDWSRDKCFEEAYKQLSGRRMA